MYPQINKFFKKEQFQKTTASETRLGGLAIIYIHRDSDIKLDSVIDEFSKCNRPLVL